MSPHDCSDCLASSHENCKMEACHLHISPEWAHRHIDHIWRVSRWVFFWHMYICLFMAISSCKVESATCKSTFDLFLVPSICIENCNFAIPRV